jgi:hypothetical protein
MVVGMADVRLVDLDVIKRFSLAVRRDAVPAEELLASLDASRAVVLAALSEDAPARPRPRRTTPAATTAARATGAARARGAATGAARKRAPK